MASLSHHYDPAGGGRRGTAQSRARTPTAPDRRYRVPTRGEEARERRGKKASERGDGAREQAGGSVTPCQSEGRRASRRATPATGRAHLPHPPRQGARTERLSVPAAAAGEKKHRRKTERHRAHGGRERHRRWGAPGRLRRPGIAEREGGRVDRRGPPTGGWWAGTRAAAHPKRLAGRDAATPTATRAGRPGRCRGRRWRCAPTPAVRKRRRTRRGRADRLGQWRATGRRSARTAAGRTRQEGNNARWRGGRVDGGQGAGAGGRWGGRHRRRVGQGGGDQHHKQTKEGTAGTKRVKKKRGGAKKKRTECRVHRDTPMPTTITTDVSRRTHP